MAVLAVLMFASSIPASAAIRHVEIKVLAEVDESKTALGNRALTSGLETGVFTEALALLPGTLEQTRRDILERYLRARTKTFVRDYTVVSEHYHEDALVLTLDVSVNSPRLRRLLQDLGIWYTLSGHIAYQLALRGVAPDKWEQINTLQTMSGLTSLAGADPSLSLELRGDTWSARLKGRSGARLDSDKNLGDLWARIWGRYFRRTESPAVEAEPYTLVVSGFATTQEPYTFHTELGRIQGVKVQGMRDISVLAEGASASWKIDVQNQDIFERQLKELTGRRGLTWRMELP